MKAGILTTAMLSLCFTGLSLAQNDQATPVSHVDSAELRQLVKTAHTPEQYKVLASYYRLQEESYRTKAASEKLLWENREQHIAVNLNKYPRPADSAHALYDSYTYDAEQAGKKASYYEQLAR